MTPEELEEFLSAIAKRGAFEALQATGLNDEYAGADVRDLRDLLKGFRVVRKTAIKTIIAGLGRIIGWVIVIVLIGLFMNGEKAKLLMEAFK